MPYCEMRGYSMSVHERDPPDSHAAARADLNSRYSALTDPREKGFGLCSNVESDGSLVIYHPYHIENGEDEWIKHYRR